MGPFHVLATELGMPAWMVQRSWMSLLLVVAFLGVVRLAARLELGTSNTRLLGGLAYALSPRFLTLLGGNSAELWPMAVLPWVLLPLVGAQARSMPRRAAMRSGAAVLCMGAANATTVLALLPLPALYLLPGLRRAAGRRLAAWWSVAVVLACTWWFVPLVLQGQYSSDFLNYIETAATTTTFTGPPQVLSGTSHWLGYLSVGGVPWWRAGFLLVTNGPVLFDVGLLAALGLVGLLARGMPRQGRLALAAGLGVMIMAAPHIGPLDGPFSRTAQHLLDGGLAAFRNIHKFDGLVRLPLALGLCHLIAQTKAVGARRVLSGVVVVALAGASAPAIAGELVPIGGYTAIPSWWVDAGHWLDDHDASGHALVLPARGFGEYYWGRTLDDPLQALTKTSWAVRDAVPLGSPGSTRLLDAIEQRIDSGQGSAALSQVLARMGISYLVVSGDLTAVGTPRRALVQQALDRTPGLSRAATFGPSHGGDPFRSSVSDSGLEVGLPTIQVLRVAGGDDPVTTLPAAGTWRVTGGPESLFPLADKGLLQARATVLAGDPTASAVADPQTVLTDSLRRREINFGQVRDNSSPTLSADAVPTVHRPTIDVLPVPGSEHLATARLDGASSVTASSSASDVTSLLHTGPENQPLSAFDGDPATTWRSGGLGGARGEWVQVALTAPVDPSGATIQPGAGVTEVSVRTDHGAVTTPLDGTATTQPLRTSDGPTQHLRVTVTRVRTDGFGVRAAITEVTVPHLSVSSSVVLPDDQSQTADPVVLLDRAGGARDSCLQSSGHAICSTSLQRVGEDDVGLDRTFSLEAAVDVPIAGTAQPVPGAPLDAWLDRGMPVQVMASSRLVDHPAVRPAQVLDGRAATAWIAGVDDPAPRLTLSWSTPRTVDQLRVTTASTVVAARPIRVSVVMPGTTVDLDVPEDGVLRFPAQRTDRIELRFTSWETRTSYDPDGTRHSLPVGVSEVSVPALASLVRPPVPDSATVSLPCGSGPPVVLDGTSLPTAALGRRADLEALTPLILGVCAQHVHVGAGQHRIRGGEQGAVRAESLDLGRPVAGEAQSAPARSVVVRTWDNEHRVVSVGSGAATYLVVHENLNRGWRAELDGQALTAVRLDGWQQAWLVPAGDGGQITMSFAPGHTFHLALALGGVLALLLIALALLPCRARPVKQDEELAGLPLALRAVLAICLLGLLGGVPVVITYVVLLLAAFWRRRAAEALVLVSGVLAIASAAVTAASPWGGGNVPALLARPATVCALLALAAAAAVLSVPRSPIVASAPEPGSPPVAD